MTPRKPPEPEQPPPRIEGGTLPAAVRERLTRRAQAFAEATSRPPGKPWAANTYGAGRQLNDAERKARAKAIRDHEAAAKRAAEGEPLN